MDNLAVSSVTGEVSRTIDLKTLLGLAQGSRFLNGFNGPILEQLIELDVSDAQVLSIINALENTQLQLKMSPAGDVAVTAVRLNQFTLFPKLPNELRMRIWKEACFGPRIVEVDISAYPAEGPASTANRNYTTRTPTPAVLHVCSEARQIGLEHYNWIFRRPFYFNVKDPKEHIIYVNFEQDTILLSLGQQQIRSQNFSLLRLGMIEQNALYPGTLCRIKRIAIPIPPNPDPDAYQYFDVLRMCTGLTEVIIVYDQGENAFGVKQDASMNQYPSGRKILRFLEPPFGEKTSCKRFVWGLRFRLPRATYERLPPLITCKRLERI